MLMMDDPEHSRLRKIVARGFTPRQVAEHPPRPYQRRVAFR
jgi:cytochrome P450